MLLKDTVEGLKKIRDRKIRFLREVGMKSAEIMEVSIVVDGKQIKEPVSSEAIKMALFYDIIATSNVIAHNEDNKL